MHKRVFESLRKSILAGKYQPGDKLPSEAMLVRRFSTSRITVGRALRDLKQAGLVEASRGIGNVCAVRRAHGNLRTPHSRLWPHRNFRTNLSGDVGRFASLRDGDPWQLCQEYVARKVRRLLRSVGAVADAGRREPPHSRDAGEAGIPVVLLDRWTSPFPARSNHDLVSVDNRRAGYLVTEHLLKLGSRRIAFVCYPPRLRRWKRASLDIARLCSRTAFQSTPR